MEDKKLADLAAAPHKAIFRPQPGTAYSRDVWAPEVMFLEGNGMLILQRMAKIIMATGYG